MSSELSGHVGTPPRPHHHAQHAVRHQGDVRNALIYKYLYNNKFTAATLRPRDSGIGASVLAMPSFTYTNAMASEPFTYLPDVINQAHFHVPYYSGHTLHSCYVSVVSLRAIFTHVPDHRVFVSSCAARSRPPYRSYRIRSFC
jgi:hypothetical protein